MGTISDLLKGEISQRYTNHCIRVTGATNLSKIFNSKQVMSITGHKSLQSLALYQHVRSDEKMAMGLSLTYSLFQPKDAFRMMQTAEYKDLVSGPKLPLPAPVVPRLNTNQQITTNEPLPGPSTSVQIPNAPHNNVENQTFIVQLPEPPVNNVIPVTTPEPHALQTTSVLPLDSALVPYKTPSNSQEKEGKNESPAFDILQLLQDVQGDKDVMLAASQYESSLDKTTNKTAIIKTSSPKVPPVPTFHGCHIGSINIHIHKN